MSEATVQFVEIARQHAANTARYPLPCATCKRVTDHRLARLGKVDVYTCGVCRTTKVDNREQTK